MTVDLSTTNLLLGIMAAVSVLEALVVIGIGVGGFDSVRDHAGIVGRWLGGRIVTACAAWALTPGIEGEHQPAP